MLLESLEDFDAGQHFPCITDLKFKTLYQNMLVQQIEKCCNFQQDWRRKVFPKHDRLKIRRASSEYASATN